MKLDVCEKIVNYGRTQIVGNEEQFLATVLSYVSCYAPSDNQYISTIIVGESAGGKTHLNKTAVQLLNESSVKHLTSGSEKSMIYSDDLRGNDDIKFINMSELQKLPPAILEFMKGLSGDDGEFTYEYTNAAKGCTETITQVKRPYTVTYAQVEIDKELKTRVFIIPVTENVDINRCVAALKFGATEVTYRGRTYGHISEHDIELKREELKNIIDSLSMMPMEVAIDFPFALIDMVNHSRPESKRHAQLINSLISSSCRLNFSERKVRDGKLVASAQDIVNMMSMFGLLQATMMGIDMIDSLMYKYISKMPRCSSSQIIAHLTGLGFGELTRTEMNRRLEKLHDENYIERESTVDGLRFFANESKQILSIQVDWQMIYKCDQSEVTDPLTSEVYSNICEYGKMVSRMHQIVSPSDEDTSDNISERECIIREAIIGVLEQDGKAKQQTLAVKAATHVDGASWYDVLSVITTMTEERILDRCDFDETFTLRNNI